MGEMTELEQEEREEFEDRMSKLRAKVDMTIVEIRRHTALQMAVDMSYGHPNDHEAVLNVAKVFEAYLKGE